MPRTVTREKMVLISVHLPKQMLEELDKLVAEGMYPSRSEAIRAAVRNLIRDMNQGNLEPELMIGR